ncbi:MAG: hypothetical protein NTZ13_00670 [Candidatus Parcubacteria bacterium]|nr:hypothetical protein [Candidatus Parcubacteria bacterium]
METNDPFNFGEKKNEGQANLIGGLEKKLYSRVDEIKHKERTKLNPKKFGHLEDWGEESDLSYKKKPEEPGMSIFGKFFLFSLGFFVVAAIIAGYSFLSKRSVISPENVDISLFGPVSLKGGEELSLQISVENKNEVPLNNIQIVVNFPKGSRYSTDTGKDLSRYPINIPSIASKEVRTETVKGIILGDENQQKSVAVAMKFRIEGVGSIYAKNKTFPVNLTSSPLSIKADILKEAISGQEVTLGIDVKGLSTAVLKSPILDVVYPKGFVFKSASPAPTYDNDSWNLGDMKLGDEKHIDIVGSIIGENEQEKVFVISAGVPTEKDTTRIDTKIAALSQGLFIKKPFLGINLFLNGSANPEYVLIGGGSPSIEARWVNRLSGKIIDAQVTIMLTGDMIDPRKVTPKGNGYYDSVKQTVVWDSRTTPTLSSIESGGENTASLTFGLLPFLKSDKTVFKNPEISVKVSVKGKRIAENNVPENIDLFVDGKIKIATSAKVSPSILFKTGPFTNSGPVPFKVGQETTATIVWKISNSVNDISGARMKAVLPSFVRWIGKSMPDTSDITFNSVNGEVVWNIGAIKAGAGYESAAKEISFQIGVTPVLSQADKIPTVVSGGTFTGTDDFTGTLIQQNIVNSLVYTGNEPGFTREWLIVHQ